MCVNLKVIHIAVGLSIPGFQMVRKVLQRDRATLIDFAEYQTYE